MTRIKDLTTTATIAAPDDFWELDGSTNGSRKFYPGNIAAPGMDARPGLISAGLTAAGTTQDNTGLAFGTGDLSFGAWVRLADWTPAAAVSLFRKSSGADAAGIHARVMTGGNLRVTIGGTAYDSTAAIGATDGAWVFLAATLDRDGNFTPYANGAALGSPVSIAATAANSATVAGVALEWLGAYTAFYPGTLGETFIVSGLLSASRIADIYRAGSIAPFCTYTANTTTGQNTATIDGLSFFQWLDFGQGYGPIFRDRSGNNQHALIGTSGLVHAVPRNPPGVPARAPRTALVSDGSNGARILSTLNSQNPNTGEIALWWDGVFPTDAAGSAKLIAALTSSATSAFTARSLHVGYQTGDGLYALLCGATTSDFRYRRCTTALTLLGGRRGVLAVTRTAIFLGVDGEFFNATNLFAEVTGGSAPAWTDQIDGQFLLDAHYATNSSSAHLLYDLRLANVAMTEAQLRTEYERGEPGPEWQWGSNTAVYSSDFSAGVDGWVAANGTVTGNVDSISGVNDTLQIEASGGITSAAAHKVITTTAFPAGRYLRLRFSVFVPATNSAGGQYISIRDQFSAGLFGQIATGLSNSLLQPTLGAWVDYDIVAPLVIATTSLQLRLANSGGSGSSVGATDRINVKNVSVRAVGYTARLRTDLAAGLTAIDGSSNKQDFMLSTTGVTTSPNGRRQIIRPGTLTFTNPGTLNLQLFGASVVDTAKKWRIVSFSGTANGSANLSLGNVSAGAQYFSAQAVTSGDFDIANFVSRRTSGANVWLASSATVTITDPVLILEQVD
jgi:hypothetical protein